MSSEKDEEKKGLSTSWIVLIVLSSISLVVLIVAIIYLIKIRNTLLMLDNMNPPNISRRI
jgi:hypothetical protein